MLGLCGLAALGGFSQRQCFGSDAGLGKRTTEFKCLNADANRAQNDGRADTRQRVGIYGCAQSIHHRWTDVASIWSRDGE